MSYMQLQGVQYISSDGWEFNSTKEITAREIKRLTTNPYFTKVKADQSNLIFTDRPTIKIKNAKGEIDEDLSIEYLTNSEGIKLVSKMTTAFNECFDWGCSILNPIIERTGNEYRISEIRILPSFSFTDPPQNGSKTYSEIVEGITFEPTSNSIGYYQTSATGHQTKLNTDDLILIKDPNSTDLIPLPIGYPVMKFIRLLDFAWQANLQQINRIGADSVIIRISNPKGAIGDKESDEDYAWKIVKNWSKDNSFILRENMEFVSPQTLQSDIAGTSIKMLENRVDTYYSPYVMISKDGTMIGGSDKSAYDLLLSHVDGIQQWLSSTFEQLYDLILELNGYTGYTAQVLLPTPTRDTTEEDLAKGEFALKSKTAGFNELRKLWGAEPIDTTEQKRIEEYYATNGATISPAMFTDGSIQHKNTPEEKQIVDDFADGYDNALKKIMESITTVSPVE